MYATSRARARARGFARLLARRYDRGMRRALSLLAFVTAAAVAPVAAGQTGSWLAVDVDVGTAAELEVGNAIGWFCDDPSLVSAAIVTDRGRNVWVVQGARAGTTECRIGTDPSRASYLVTITVKEGRSNRR